MNRAENNAGPFLPTASFVKRYVARAQRPANEGARKTHTFQISTGNPSQ